MLVAAMLVAGAVVWPPVLGWLRETGVADVVPDERRRDLIAAAAVTVLVLGAVRSLLSWRAAVRERRRREAERDTWSPPSGDPVA